MSELGLLLIHGFTSDPRAMQPIKDIAEALGYVTESPLLRGHGLTYHHLRGVRWEDWMADVAEALESLRARTERVVVVGFSMGGLLALDMAAQHADLDAVIALAPALRIAHPLAPYAFLGKGWLRFVNMGKSVAYSDPLMAKDDWSYGRLAIDSFVSFYRATRRIEQRLPRIKVPLLVMHAERDRVIRPEAAAIAYNQTSSTEKELVWLSRSGHALLEDVDAGVVLEHVKAFLARRLGTIPPRTAAET